MSPNEIHRLITNLVTEIRENSFLNGIEKAEKFLINKFNEESNNQFYQKLEG
ncbi:MAG: hypothetical protein NY202_05570 [Mollicutes bacterium UO1]